MGSDLDSATSSVAPGLACLLSVFCSMGLAVEPALRASRVVGPQQTVAASVIPVPWDLACLLVVAV